MYLHEKLTGYFGNSLSLRKNEGKWDNEVFNSNIQELGLHVFSFALLTLSFFDDTTANSIEESGEGTYQAHTGPALEN